MGDRMRNDVLIGIRSVAYFLGVRKEKVREYEERGAPIYRDERGWMIAEKGNLSAWVQKNIWKQKTVK